MTPVLALRDVTKSFGAVTVADATTLDVAEGEAVGIIGPNGAGKTSLFNLVTGALAPDRGTVHFRGEDVTRVSAARRCRAGMARSHQVPQPFGGMSVFENVLVGATAGGALRGSAADRAALNALDRTGLTRRANTRAGALTLLERKRLELARALAVSPRLLLLDEIAGGLTEGECEALVGTIRAIHAEGTTIVWIEHIVHALLAVVDRLIVIDFGRIVASGEPRAIMASETVREIYMGVDIEAAAPEGVTAHA